MHCLPANDERETTREVMDGDRSLIFDEAENVLVAQMALLVYLTHKDIAVPDENLLRVHADRIDAFLATL